MIPGSEEIIRRHPWTGVVLGLVGLALMCAIAGAFAQEWRRFSGQARPEPVSFDRLDFDRRGSRWVTLSGGAWHWDDAIEVPRPVPERWLFGAIEHTEVPVTDTARRRLLVAMFDGRLDSNARAARSFDGVVAGADERTWSGSPRTEWTARPHVGRVLALHVGAGPASARLYLLGASAFMIFFAAFAAYWWREQSRRGEQLSRAA